MEKCHKMRMHLLNSKNNTKMFHHLHQGQSKDLQFKDKKGMNSSPVTMRIITIQSK
jgi:hypothetical protein